MTGNFNITANTGWVANAYMNAGTVGILIYSIFVSALFSVIDFWARIYGKRLVGPAFFVPVITLIMSADLFIVILTSGLYALLIIFYFASLRIRIYITPRFNQKQITKPVNA